MRPLSSTPPLWTIGISLILSVLPWGRYVLYPFKLFTTWVHECSHAAMAVCLGGRVQSITLSPDTSGLTSHSISRSRIRQSLVASAGYLGSTVAGCLLYGSSVRYASHSNWIISTLGAAMGLSLIFWIRNLFGAFVVLSWAIVLIALGQNSLWGLTPGPLLLFLAIQTGLQSLFDLRILFELDAGIQSDAKTLQSLLWLPAGFWALFWIGLSLLMMGWTIRWT